MKGPSRHEIWKMFDEISPTYDSVNRLMSFGLDQYWRKKLLHFLPDRTQLHVLDCATGTADQLICLLQHASVETVVGIDLSSEMLALANKKIHTLGFQNKATVLQADILELPFEPNTFDCITISFGIRNVVDVVHALRTMHRALKPEGRLLILESAVPQHLLLKPFFLFYLRHIMPRLGAVFSRHRKAYRYLNQTIETFPSGEQFCQLLRKTGYCDVQAHPLTAGSVCVYQADKRP